jgi:hypothetical protein
MRDGGSVEMKTRNTTSSQRCRKEWAAAGISSLASFFLKHNEKEGELGPRVATSPIGHPASFVVASVGATRQRFLS